MNKIRKPKCSKCGASMLPEPRGLWEESVLFVCPNCEGRKP